MSCVLRIMGVDFDPDGFEIKSGLSLGRKLYKGTPRFKSKPDSEKAQHSVISFVVSSADFHSPEKQIEDAKNYLIINKDGLSHILNDKSIQHAFLDFGLQFYPDRVTQSIYLPHDIVSPAGALGIGIEISLYNNDRFE
ncbi:MAG: hypothetical protein H3C54_02900 [Taibaiella sp.]|nr:hypothetical protein [Taibaiella sp.]